MNLFSKKNTSSFDEPADTVEAFERQMRIEGLKTGNKSKKGRDYSKYMVVGAIAALLFLAIKWMDHFGFFVLVGIALFVAGFYLYMEWRQSGMVQNDDEKRLELLRFKYSDAAMVHRMNKGVIWKGESAEQLVDSLGAPGSIKPLKGRDTSNAVWGYDGRVAYESIDDKKQKKLVYEEGLLIELKDGIVAGWERK